MCRTLPQHLINHIMMIQPRPKFVEEIKNLFSTYYKIFGRVDKGNDDFNKFFARENTFCIPIRERLFKQSRVLNSCDYDSDFLENITPFSYNVGHIYNRHSYNYKLILTKNDFKTRPKPNDIIGKSIKQKKYATIDEKFNTGDWSDISKRYILTQDLKNLLTQNGLEYKKSWSRKKLVQELMKL